MLITLIWKGLEPQDFVNKGSIYAAFQKYQKVIFVKNSVTAVSLCTAEFMNVLVNASHM